MSECIHHWVLESPNGPDCKAECKKCKETTVFLSIWDVAKKPRLHPHTNTVVYVEDIAITPQSMPAPWLNSSRK